MSSFLYASVTSYTSHNLVHAFLFKLFVQFQFLFNRFWGFVPESAQHTIRKLIWAMKFLSNTASFGKCRLLFGWKVEIFTLSPLSSQWIDENETAAFHFISFLFIFFFFILRLDGEIIINIWLVVCSPYYPFAYANNGEHALRIWFWNGSLVYNSPVMFRFLIIFLFSRN